MSDRRSITLLHTLSARSSTRYGVSDVQISPGGVLVATANQQMDVRLWSATTGALLRSIPYAASRIAFHPRVCELAVTVLQTDTVMLLRCFEHTPTPSLDGARTDD